MATSKEIENEMLDTLTDVIMDSDDEYTTDQKIRAVIGMNLMEIARSLHPSNANRIGVSIRELKDSLSGVEVSIDCLTQQFRNK